jgi:hypothetical protein
MSDKPLVTEEDIDEDITYEQCDYPSFDEYHERLLKFLNNTLSEKIVHSADENELYEGDDDNMSLISYDSIEFSFDENE